MSLFRLRQPGKQDEITHQQPPYVTG